MLILLALGAATLGLFLAMLCLTLIVYEWRSRQRFIRSRAWPHGRRPAIIRALWRDLSLKTVHLPSSVITARASLAAVMAFLLIGGSLAVADKVVAATSGPTGDTDHRLARTEPVSTRPSGSRGSTRRIRPVVEIKFVDVGQGDGVVLRVRNTFVVSDAGEFHPDRVDAALHALGAPAIDIALLTHPHQDHVKNFIDLLETYDWTIKTAVLSRSDHWAGTKTNRRLITALKDHGAKLQYVAAGARFGWGGAQWEVLNPPAGKYTGHAQAGNASIVYLLRSRHVQFLFPGDIASAVERQVAQRWTQRRLGQAAVFLTTHHGSAGGSGKFLLDAIHPTWAVLSTGPNRFKHPTTLAIERLRGAGASIWCTDVNGTITARVSQQGRLSWTATDQLVPWWSATTSRQTGRCVKR